MKYLSLSINGAQIPPPSGVPTGGLGINEPGQRLFQFGVNLIFIIGIVLTVIFIIISGIQMIVSGGDKQKVQAARGRLTYAIIGLLVIAGAFAIVSLVISLLGGNPSFFFNPPSTSSNGFTPGE